MIYIPSRKIYSKENPKIRNNVIDNVSVGITKVVNNDEYDIPVYSHNEDTSNSQFNEWELLKTEFANSKVTSNSTGYIHYVASAVGIRPAYAKNITIAIPRQLKTSYISTIKKEGTLNVSYSVIYRKSTGIATINVLSYGQKMEGASDYIYEKRAFVYNKYEESKGTLPEMTIEKTVEKSVEYSSPISVTANLTVQDETNITDLSRSKVEETTDTYNVKLDILLCGEERYSAEAKGSMTEEDWGGAIGTVDKELTLTGTCEKYEPIAVEITFNGNTIGISLEDSTSLVGSGNLPYSTNGNELIQNTGTTDGKLTSKVLGDNIIANYKNGKETAVIRCSIGDYYSYTSYPQTDEPTKVISIDKANRMTFHNGDIVLPFVFGADGKDYPMSLNKNGSAKLFEVVGNRIYYDGAVWQEISLQEYIDI